VIEPAASPRPVAPATSYPPTRPPSPRALSFQNALDIQSTAQIASDEWREEHSPQNPLAAPSVGGLDGMGTTSTMTKGAEPRATKGAGYFGLSSGATLLHAIRRLAPGEVFPSGLAVSESLNVVDVQAISGTSRLNPKTPTSPTAFSIKNLPPPAEVLPLVDSYFRYFRELERERNTAMTPSLLITLTPRLSHTYRSRADCASSAHGRSTLPHE
jgi:transcriptional regulatory protein GAL4